MTAILHVTLGAWLCVTVLLAKSYHRTAYGPKSKAFVLVAWPALLACSSEFRNQFLRALLPDRSVDRDDADGSMSGP